MCKLLQCCKILQNYCRGPEEAERKSEESWGGTGQLEEAFFGFRFYPWSLCCSLVTSQASLSLEIWWWAPWVIYILQNKWHFERLYTNTFFVTKYKSENLWKNGENDNCLQSYIERKIAIVLILLYIYFQTYMYVILYIFKCVYINIYIHTFKIYPPFNILWTSIHVSTYLRLHCIGIWIYLNIFIYNLCHILKHLRCFCFHK